MWKIIYDKLRENNLNPYAPGQHKGFCFKPYCIIKEGLQMPSIQSNKVVQKTIDIIVFVPIRSYKEIEPYVNKIRLVLKELKFLRKTGFESPIITDDEKKAYTMSIEYVLQKKLEG